MTTVYHSLLKRKSMTAVMLFLFSTSLPLGANAKVERIWLCKNQGFVRSILAESTASGCKAHYSKDGQSHLVGQISQAGACNVIVDRIKENLVSSQWQCREVAQYSETLLVQASAMKPVTGI